jgi:hypothetical protein
MAEFLADIAGGIAVGLCTITYWFQYRSQGDFDGAYMSFPGMMHHPAVGAGMGMGPGMMGPDAGTMQHPMTPSGGRRSSVHGDAGTGAVKP